MASDRSLSIDGGGDDDGVLDWSWRYGEKCDGDGLLWWRMKCRWNGEEENKFLQGSS